jgi:hypothetical protein
MKSIIGTLACRPVAKMENQGPIRDNRPKRLIGIMGPEGPAEEFKQKRV